MGSHESHGIIHLLGGVLMWVSTQKVAHAWQLRVAHLGPYDDRGLFSPGPNYHYIGPNIAPLTLAHTMIVVFSALLDESKYLARLEGSYCGWWLGSKLTRVVESGRQWETVGDSVRQREFTSACV
jgi:hypothetical protein